MPDPHALGYARRVDTLIVWLLLAVSVPPALGLVLPALANPANPFWRTQAAIDWGWRAGGALGVVACLCGSSFATWGHFVPPLLAALAAGRLIAVRRAVVLTAAYIVTMVVIHALWLLYIAQYLPARSMVYSAIDVLVRSVLPGIVPLVLAWYPRPASREYSWRWAADVTRVVLVCSGVLGLLLTAGVLFSWRFRPIMVSFYARYGLEGAVHAAQLCGGLLLVRHGLLRRRWLWIATAGAALAWGLNLTLELTLQPPLFLMGPDVAENWFLAQSLLGSLAAAAVVLLWYWWPVLVGRRQVADGPLCLSCGYNLTGNVSGRCPECGELIQPQSE